MNSHLKTHFILLSIFFFLLSISLISARSSHVQSYCEAKKADYTQQTYPQIPIPPQIPLPITGASIQDPFNDETYLLNCCEQVGCNYGYCTEGSQEGTCIYFCKDLGSSREGSAELQDCMFKENSDPIIHLEKSEDNQEQEGKGTVCGNGKREQGEQCDDGNNEKGNGCSETCNGEEGYVCKEQNEKSICLTSLCSEAISKLENDQHFHEEVIHISNLIWTVFASEGIIWPLSGSTE